MAETTDTKKPAAKKPAAPKATATKAASAPVNIKEAAPAKKAASSKNVVAKKAERTSGLRVTQINSGAGRSKAQIGTLVGLGLGKLHRSKMLEDTPSVRGMVASVQHLVKMEVVG